MSWSTIQLARVKTLLHSFRMYDVEDPYLFAAAPIHEWQQTEMGKWVMEHVTEQAIFHCTPDPVTWGYTVKITGILEEADLTYLKLKYGL